MMTSQILKSVDFANTQKSDDLENEIIFFLKTLVVAVISVDAYPFLAFSDLTCHLEDTGVGVFWLHCAT